MVSNQPTELAEPFSQIFSSEAEAHWAFDFLMQTAKALGLSGPGDQRLALTVTGRGGQPGLHLTYGSWLVVGFRGGGQVELLLLTEAIAWDERFANLPAEAKEGSPAVRSYLLPLAYLRPMTSGLQRAWAVTLALVAEKFHGWKRAIPWKKHQTELVEALFDETRRQQLFAAGLAEPELLYERQLTAFYHDISEEAEGYETDEITESTVLVREVQSPFEQDKLPPDRSILMDLSPQKINLIISLIRQQYPTWSNFSDPAYVADEINYKRTTVNLVKQLLSKDELDRLIREEQFDEFIERLDKVGKDNNLLWR
ncbi:MAG: hypothetical protein KDF65_09755, partial [Anaerolineae bacterium]|nr:hypothetical protein [Anaerolineae bacterium]